MVFGFVWLKIDKNRRFYHFDGFEFSLNDEITTNVLYDFMTTKTCDVSEAIQLISPPTQ